MRNTDVTPPRFDCQQLNGATVNNAPQAVIASEEMRRRPVYSKDLGEFFTSLREAHGWNQSEAAEFAHRRGHKPLTRQVLLRLERGQTKNPEPEVLRSVAKLYGISYPRIIAAVVKCRYNIDVTDRAALNTETGVESGSVAGTQEGGADAHAGTSGGHYADVVTAHAERLIHIANAIIGTSELGHQLESVAESLITGLPSTTRAPSARETRDRRKDRTRVRGTDLSRARGK